MAAFVERVDGRENDPGARVDQIDSAEVPASVAHGDVTEVAVPRGNFETHTLERNRAVAPPLASRGPQAERVTQRFTRRTRAKHMQRSGETLHRRACCLAVNRAVVLDFHPRLGHFVESLERQVSHAIEHSHQPPFKRSPEGLLLPILIGATGKRSLVDDAQVKESLGGFLGDHGRAVVGEERSWKAALLDCLGESVHEVFSGLREVPLDMAAKPRVVIENAQRDRAHPLAVGSEHLER